MLDIQSINAISGTLAAIGVLVGVVFAILELRNLVEARQTSSLESIRGLVAGSIKRLGRRSETEKSQTTTITRRTAGS